jgi:hypothetical protein
VEVEVVACLASRANQVALALNFSFFNNKLFFRRDITSVLTGWEFVIIQWSVTI